MSPLLIRNISRVALAGLVAGCALDAPLDDFSADPADPAAAEAYDDEAVDALAQAATTPNPPPHGRQLVRVELSKLFYKAGQAPKVTVTPLVAGAIPAGRTRIPVVLTSSVSKDLEVFDLSLDGSGRYVSTNVIKIVDAGVAPAKVRDGRLSAAPGESIYALYYPEKPIKGDAAIVFDMGLIEDLANVAPAPVVLPELAASPGELTPPAGGKRLGTVVEQDGQPMQLPVDELIVYTSDPAELGRFLADTGGTLLASDRKAGANEAAVAHLVKVSPSKGDVAHLPQMLAMVGMYDQLYVSNSQATGLVALALGLQLQGYAVSPNPRLSFHAAPRTVEGTHDPDGTGPLAPVAIVPRQQHTDPAFRVDRAWTEVALRDADTARVNVAFLDMGFAPNGDFRRPASGAMVECNMEGTGSPAGFTCGPGTAVSTPTVGASFFGAPTWHGNMTVTAAGGMLNNGYGAVGVAGQVMQPMLYRYGLAAYAFEIGLGIERAVADGASVVNVSAGYPCRLVTRLGLSPGICTPVERAGVCTLVTAGLVAAAATVCAHAAALAAIPIIGPIVAGPAIAACGAATAAAVAGSTACFSTLIAGNVAANMQRGVTVATAAGVPVVASAGNQLNLTPPLSDIVDLSVTSVDAWRTIPCTLPGVICVGSASAFAPFANVELNGASVDIWAPNGVEYFAPDTTGAVTASALQRRHATPGASSGGAAYISGTIALLQAVNPDLDPRRTTRTGSARAAIPGLLLGTLRGTANPAIAGRGLLVNPLAAVRSAAVAGGGPNLATLGYLTTMDTAPEETLFDTALSAHDFGVFNTTRTRLGTVHRIPAVTASGMSVSGVLSTDVDFYTGTVPTTSTGLWRLRFEVRVPRALGRVRTQGDPLTLVSTLTGVPSAAEDTLIFESGLLFSGTRFTFAVAAPANADDNVYILTARPATFVAAAPAGDRFDRDNSLNPPESRPANNDQLHAAHLGADVPFDPAFAWVNRSLGGLWGLTLANLSFHSTTDVDWFELVDYPNFGFHPDRPGCIPELVVDAGPDVRIEVIEGGIVLASGVGPLTLNRRPFPPTFIKLTPRVPGSFFTYALDVEFLAPLPAICGLP